jgi:membrane fusion protein (multidrug efflux system)
MLSGLSLGKTLNLAGRSLCSVLVAVGLTAALAACSKSGESADTSSQKPGDSTAVTVPVQAVKVVPGDIASMMTFAATVQSERNVSVYPQATGPVIAVLAEEGDRVRAGQVVLQLDDDDAQIACERANLDQRKYQRDSVRMAELFGRNLESREAYEAIVYQAGRARLSVQEAALGLQRTRIRAPVTGVITERKVEIGDRVSPGSEVYKMVSADNLIAEVFVPGRTRQHIRTGQAARITSEMLPGYEVDGTITRINPVVDPQSGTVKVTVEVKDTSHRFTPGMFANVALITDSRAEALLIPKEAITYDAGQSYVFVAKAGVARRKQLHTGLANSRLVEALSGVSVGDSIVIVGQEGLRDGAKVRLITSALRPVAPATTSAKPRT